MCTGAEPAAAGAACGAGTAAEGLGAMGTADAGLGSLALGDMAATGAGAGVLGAEGLGMGAMTAGELGAGFGADMAAAGYGGTAAEGLGTLGGAEIGAANAGTMGGDATAFGQGGIAPQATGLGADVISPATNVPSAMGPNTASQLGTQFQEEMTNAGISSSPTLGTMFQSGMDALNKPLWQGGMSTRQGLTGLQLGGGLYDMYAKNKMADAQSAQMNKINSMYAPGSPEYNLMMQQIARKDAAAGRNSQYGPRAQTLAGIIAKQKADMLTSPTYATLSNQQLGNKYGSLNSLFALGGKVAAPQIAPTTGG
jgi:hypothetical protein